MKKRCALLIVMLMGCLTGCLNAEEAILKKSTALRVITERYFAADIEYAVEYFEKQYPDVEIEIQLLAGSEEEREAQLQKIRTETMAGKGPDIFVLSSPDELIAKEDQSEVLFSNVNKAMESGVFAPLNEYMKSDTYWENGTYNKKILEAGTWKEKQYVIPLGCNYFVYIHPKGEGQMNDVTLDEWLDEVKYSANEEMKTSVYQTVFFLMPSRMIQPAIDYANEEVLYNRDIWKSAIMNHVSEYRRIVEKSKDSENTYSDNYEVQRIDLLDIREDGERAYQVVPNVMGRKIAAITEYGAVSMASKNKDMSYEFLMLLLNDKLAAPMHGYLNMGGAPVQQSSWRQYLSQKGIMTDDGKETITKSFNEIEGAYFPIETDCLLYDKFTELLLSGKYQKNEFAIWTEEIADEFEKQYELIAKE